MRPYVDRFLSTGLILLIFIANQSIADIADSPTAVVPLKVGESAPPFLVRHADGTPYRFDGNRLTRPIVLIFYRGGWCPYCNLQLADLHEVVPKLRRTAFDVIFLSTDQPQLLYSSLKKQNKHLAYTLLSDNQLHAAEAFHIAYRVDAATYAKQISFGVDLEKTTGTNLHELPVPSVFIIDRSGTIRFVYSNPDYTVRLKAEQLWAAAEPLAVSR